MQNKLHVHVAALLLFAFALLSSATSQCSNLVHIQYRTPAEFLQQAFKGNSYNTRLLKLNPELLARAKTILEHPYRGRRIRYWQAGNRTAWMFDEIGKEQPITIGLVVENGNLQALEILTYREERGGEVHQSFFTRQFIDASLQAQDQLSVNIDGITGATLSVNAVTRVARLTLALAAHVAE